VIAPGGGDLGGGLQRKAHHEDGRERRRRSAGLKVTHLRGVPPQPNVACMSRQLVLRDADLDADAFAVRSDYFSKRR
jgi:hypothetical protein